MTPERGARPCTTAPQETRIREPPHMAEVRIILSECGYIDKCGGTGGVTFTREALWAICSLFAYDWTGYQVAQLCATCHCSRETVLAKVRRVRFWWGGSRRGGASSERLLSSSLSPSQREGVNNGRI